MATLEGNRKYKTTLLFLIAGFVLAAGGLLLDRAAGAALLISTLGPYLITFTIGNVREHVARNGGPKTKEA